MWLYTALTGTAFTRHSERKLRYLDSLVINKFIERTESELRFQTIRYPFEEGEAIFPGSMIRDQSHIQLAVRDIQCIQSVSLVGA
jgi:hypothetical protein